MFVILSLNTMNKSKFVKNVQIKILTIVLFLKKIHVHVLNVHLDMVQSLKVKIREHVQIKKKTVETVMVFRMVNVKKKNV